MEILRDPCLPACLPACRAGCVGDERNECVRADLIPVCVCVCVRLCVATVNPCSAEAASWMSCILGRLYNLGGRDLDAKQTRQAKEAKEDSFWRACVLEWRKLLAFL